MKKYLLPMILLLLIIPFVVKAEACDNDKISISSITMENKSDQIEEIEEASATNNNIKVNLSMSEIGDNITYKIIVKNDSKEDYEIDKKSFHKESEYVDYNMELEDESNIIKANTSKTIYWNIEYKKQVPENDFNNGFYNLNNEITVNLSNANILDKINNPKTGIRKYLIFSMILLVIITILWISLKQNKDKKSLFLLIVAFIMIPISTWALCQYEIKMELEISIVNKTECLSFAEDDWDIISNNIKTSNTSCYHVGDTKTLSLNGFGNYTIRIANMSMPEECLREDYSQTACGFVIEFTNIIKNEVMNSSGTNLGGWESSKIRTTVDDEIYHSLPIELQNIIMDTKVISGHGNRTSEQNFETTDKLYLLSPMEIWGNNSFSQYDTSRDFTRQLDYYKNLGVNNNNYSAVSKKYNSLDDDWWLRSADSSSTYSFIAVEGGGYYDEDSAYSNDGISPAFRIN